MIETTWNPFVIGSEFGWLKCHGKENLMIREYKQKSTFLFLIPQISCDKINTTLSLLLIFFYENMPE